MFMFKTWAQKTNKKSKGYTNSKLTTFKICRTRRKGGITEQFGLKFYWFRWWGCKVSSKMKNQVKKTGLITASSNQFYKKLYLSSAGNSLNLAGLTHGRPSVNWTSTSGPVFLFKSITGSAEQHWITHMLPAKCLWSRKYTANTKATLLIFMPLERVTISATTRGDFRYLLTG